MEAVDRPISLMNGMDEHLIASLTFGFHGGIGSTYNFAPDFYRQIYDAFQKGEVERAMERQREINRVTRLMIEFENWSYRKAIMRYVGVDVGPCRPPYAPISEAEYEAFAQRLDSLGVLQRNDHAEDEQEEE